MDMNNETNRGTPYLDEKDRRIMYELDFNSRATSSQISKKLGINQNVVNYRINRLIERNIISDFYTVIDTPRIGFEGFRVYIKFQHMDSETEKKIMDHFVSCPSTWWVGTIDGAWDIGIVVWTENVYDFKDFWDSFMGKYKKFIHSYRTAIYTGLHNFTQAYITQDKDIRIASHFTGNHGKVNISANDRKILEVLSANARMPVVEIAQGLGLTAMTVKYAMGKLRKMGIIKGFRALYNLELLGLALYKVDLEISDFSRQDELMEMARSQKNVIYVDQTIGGGDFEIEIVAQNHAEFRKIMDYIKARFSDVIISYNYMVYSKIHKIRYF